MKKEKKVKVEMVHDQKTEARLRIFRYAACIGSLLVLLFCVVPFLNPLQEQGQEKMSLLQYVNEARKERGVFYDNYRTIDAVSVELLGLAEQADSVTFNLVTYQYDGDAQLIDKDKTSFGLSSAEEGALSLEIYDKNGVTAADPAIATDVTFREEIMVRFTITGMKEDTSTTAYLRYSEAGGRLVHTAADAVGTLVIDGNGTYNLSLTPADLGVHMLDNSSLSMIVTAGSFVLLGFLLTMIGAVIFLCAKRTVKPAGWFIIWGVCMQCGSLVCMLIQHYKIARLIGAEKQVIPFGFFLYLLVLLVTLVFAILGQRVLYKMSGGDVVFVILNYGIFTIFTLSCLFPFYYLFINTISDNELVRRGLIIFFPQGINFENYVRLSGVSDLMSSFMTTVARTVIGTVLMVAATGLAGYLVTKQELWHRRFWYRFILITMYFNAGLIPWYLNMSMLGLTNTFLAYIIPGIVAPYNIILVKTYIESIPAELEESAFIDGAGYMTIFRKIIWPLSKPILATIAIFGAVGHWNSFMDSLILMSGTPNLYTMQHRLYIYLNQASNLKSLMEGGGGATAGLALENAMNAKTIRYTISMITVLPILVVYPFMNRYFEKGLMLGAVKG